MVVKYGTNNPILSAPQLANVTTATDFDNSDNPFYLVHLSFLLSPLTIIEYSNLNS